MRDPRVDPQVGDRVRGNGHVREVVGRAGNTIDYEVYIGGKKMRANVVLVSWKNWSKACDAEVLEPKGETVDYREININDEVLVKLTPLGKNITKMKNERLRKEYPMFCSGLLDTYPFKEGNDGWYRCQLWELMREFGNEFGVKLGDDFELALEPTIRIEGGKR